MWKNGNLQLLNVLIAIYQSPPPFSILDLILCNFPLRYVTFCRRCIMAITNHTRGMFSWRMYISPDIFILPSHKCKIIASLGRCFPEQHSHPWLTSMHCKKDSFFRTISFATKMTNVYESDKKLEFKWTTECADFWRLHTTSSIEEMQLRAKSLKSHQEAEIII